VIIPKVREMAAKEVKKVGKAARAGMDTIIFYQAKVAK